MAWFEDLTAYSNCRWPEPNTVNVGWLDREHPFPKGKTPPEFRKRLTVLCRNPPGRFVTKGYHVCEFCGKVAGGNEIRVLAGEKVYAAPVLIFHYVISHRYLPPKEFIEAVMRSPGPDSPEMVSRYGPPLGHRFPVRYEDALRHAIAVFRAAGPADRGRTAKSVRHLAEQALLAKQLKLLKAQLSALERAAEGREQNGDVIEWLRSQEARARAGGLSGILADLGALDVLA